MKKITLYRIGKDLVDKYGVGVETNKNYEKVCGWFMIICVPSFSFRHEFP